MLYHLVTWKYLKLVPAVFWFFWCPSQYSSTEGVCRLPSLTSPPGTVTSSDPSKGKVTSPARAIRSKLWLYKLVYVYGMKADATSPAQFCQKNNFCSMITPEWLHHKHCSRDLGHPSHPKSNSSPARRDQRSHFKAAQDRRHNLTSVSPAIQLLHDWGIQWCHGHSLVQNPNHLGIGRSLSSSGTPGDGNYSNRTSGHVMPCL